MDLALCLIGTISLDTLHWLPMLKCTLNSAPQLIPTKILRVKSNHRWVWIIEDAQDPNGRIQWEKSLTGSAFSKHLHMANGGCKQKQQHKSICSYTGKAASNTGFNLISQLAFRSITNRLSSVQLGAFLGYCNCNCKIFI